MKGTVNPKDHVNSQEVSTFTFLPVRLPIWKLLIFEAIIGCVLKVLKG
jgi:hypothetical protein